jgi:hypothetical protein
MTVCSTHTSETPEAVLWRRRRLQTDAAVTEHMHWHTQRVQAARGHGHGGGRQGSAVNCKQRYRFPYVVPTIRAYRVFVLRQLGTPLARPMGVPRFRLNKGRVEAVVHVATRRVVATTGK